MRFRPGFRVSSSLILRTREVFFGNHRLFCTLASNHSPFAFIRARTRVPYNYTIRVRGKGLKTAIKHKNPVFAEKGSKKVKNPSADNQAVTKKMHFF